MFVQLLRDTQRAVGVLPGATLIQGDLTRVADLPDSLAGAHDRPNMPLSAEPARVRTDLERLTGRS